MRINVLIAAVVVGILLAKPASAAITINMYETGNNVVFSFSGSLNIDGLGTPNQIDITSGISPSSAVVFFAGEDVDDYSSAIVGPSSFGTGNIAFNTIDSKGDGLRINGEFSGLTLPGGYTSGETISGSFVFRATAFSTLGIDTGSAPYVWTVQNNVADTITLQVVPEPTSAVVLFGSGALICLLRRRR